MVELATPSTAGLSPARLMYLTLAHTHLVEKNQEFSISAQLILQISRDLEIDPTHIATFDWDGRTAERYRQTIREYLGYHVANIQDHNN